MTATATENDQKTGPAGHGRIARVIGPVVDVEFPEDSIPEMYNALKVDLTLGDVTTTITLEVVEGEEKPAEDEVLPLYEFEPSPESVLDALLPRYVQSRIFFALLQASASELAARQKAMKSATDNAEELIKKYTRIANQARQAGITQEISEIVGGVNALADANAAGE